MTLRGLKKRERRAAHTLCKRHGYTRGDFARSDRSESIDAPNNLLAQNSRHGFIDPGLMRGTLVIWLRISYEYDEWDAYLPSDILAEIETDWDALLADVTAGECS